MRILILNIIFILTISVSVAQEYEFRKWKYPMGAPLSGYNDSILGDYNSDNDIILDFDAGEHAICNIKIINKYLRFFRLRPYYICKIEVVDIFWHYEKFNHDTIKKTAYCILPYKNKINKNATILGTFAIYNNYISFQKKIELKKNTKYYISQGVIITSFDGIGTFSKTVNKLDKRINRK